jgi:hypothetical protein
VPFFKGEGTSWATTASNGRSGGRGRHPAIGIIRRRSRPFPLPDSDPMSCDEREGVFLFVLTTGRKLEHWLTVGTMTRRTGNKAYPDRRYLW